MTDPNGAVSAIGPVSAIGARVRDGDPDRFEAALFAAPDLRERLLTLYAFDLQLRSVWRKVSEPQLGAIRLQFWIDTVEEAARGASPRAHEIAEPLHAVICASGAGAEALAERLIDMAHSRHRDLDARAEDDVGVFFGHIDASDGAAMRAAGRICAPDLSPEADAALGDLGFAFGMARILADAPLSAAQGRFTLPLADAEVAALSEGRVTPHLSKLLASFAEMALERLASATRSGALTKNLSPATLAAWRAPRFLSRVRRGVSSLEDLGPESPARRRLSLLWRAARGW